MSAARKAADPFNFDDLYKQAGVDDLFVKKTMAESRQQPLASESRQQPLASTVASGIKAKAVSVPAKGPDPFSSLSKATAATQQQKPVVQPLNGLDLDFLGVAAKPVQPAAQPRVPAYAPAVTQASPVSSSTNGHSGMDFDFFGSSNGTSLSAASLSTASKPAAAFGDDPFAAFQAIDGAAPAVVAHAPSSTSASNLLGFDMGDEFMSVPQPAVPVLPQRPADPTFVMPASPPVQTVQLHNSISASTPSPTASHSSRDASPAHSGRPLPQATQLSRASLQAEARTALTNPNMYPVQHSGVSDTDGHVRPQHSSSGHLRPGQGDEHQYRHQHSYDGRDGLPATTHGPPRASGGSNSGAAAPSSRFQYREAGDKLPRHAGPAAMAAAAGKGLTGYLKTLGKHAVKAAQAGLQVIETTLEKMEQPGGAHSTSSTPSEVSSDEALAIAFRLADLPPHQQEETLAELPRSMRLKVYQLLREQAKLELQGGGGSAGGHTDVQTRGQRCTQDSSNGVHERWHGGGGESPTFSSGPSSPFGERAGAAEYGRTSSPMSTSFGRQQQPSSQEDLVSSRVGGQVRGDTAASRQATVAAAPPPAMFQPSFPTPMLLERHPSVNGAAAAAAQPPPQHHDMLGLDDTPPTSAPAAAPPASPPHADLLGFDGGAPPDSFSSISAPQLQPQVHSVEDVDDFFTGGSSSSAAATGKATRPAASVSAASTKPVASSVPSDTHIDDFFSGGTGGASVVSSGADGARAGGPAVRRPAAKAVDSSVFAGLDLDGLHGDADSHAALYDDDVEQEGEPEVRKILRAQRRAEQHARMKAKLAEKIAADAEEARKREEQVTLKEGYKVQVTAWKNKHKGNIRGLLGSLQTVLWEGSGWVPVSMGDLLEPNQVKRVYMKANLLVHPDKVRQRNGTAEQVAIADMIFDVLKESWEIFR